MGYFYGQIIFLCVCVFYSFFTQQKRTLFPYIDSFKQRCSKHKDMEVQIFLQDNDFISFGWLPRNKTVDSYMSSIFKFFEELPHFSIAAGPVCIPSPSVLGFPFHHVLANTSWLFDATYSSKYKVISHCGFHLHFPDNSWC